MPALVIVLLLIGWQLLPWKRTVAALLLGWAVLHLVGGAIISVLPLSFLPFVPEQTLSHYMAHIVYGLAQLPLIGVLIRQLRTTLRNNKSAAAA